MSGPGLEAISGRRYGPFRVSAAPAKLAEFVAATGDDPELWSDHAPPGWAAALLFAAAPAFFADPEVAPYTGALIHSDQRFKWSAPLSADSVLDVAGTVTGVRSRSGMNLVTFDVEAHVDDAADPALTSRSTFLMAAGTGDMDAAAEEPEPGPYERAVNSGLDRMPLPEPGDELPPLERSASRADLVRYAGATLDFNPIHWDHEAAIRAGLPGVVVHGLLMGAWSAQAAGRVARRGPHPLAELKLRFRRPLRPGEAARVASVVRSADAGSARLAIAVRTDDHDLVTGEAVVLTDRG